MTSICRVNSAWAWVSRGLREVGCDMGHTKLRHEPNAKSPTPTQRGTFNLLNSGKNQDFFAGVAAAGAAGAVGAAPGLAAAGAGAAATAGAAGAAGAAAT